MPEFIKKRQENYAILKNGLEEFGQYFSIVEATEKSEPSWFGVYPGLNEEMLKYVIESFQKFFD